MIRIDYKTSTLNYNDYIDKFGLWLNRQRCQSKHSFINSNGFVNPTVLRFVDWLLADNNLIKLCNASADDLIDYIAKIETDYPELKYGRYDVKRRKVLYDDLYYLFVTVGYLKGFQMNGKLHKLDKDELHDAIGIDVCPYCNRIYIKKQTIYRKKKTVKAELDHFYSKELYPYLAIAKHNLVPSCSFCNGMGGKFTADAYELGMVNPYAISNTNDELNFVLKIKNEKIMNLSNAAKGLGIHITAKNKGMWKNNEVFNLEELYGQHIDHAAELLVKSRIKSTDVYRKFLKSRFKTSVIELTDDEIDRFLIGNYVKEEDYGKRPLSKMYHDIALELGLIQK